MARKNQTATTETAPTEKPAEIAELEAQLKAKRAEYRRKSVIDDARAVLNEYESQFDNAKDIFFKVNGARRILKNAGLL